MKVFCLFSGCVGEEPVFMFIVSTEEEAKRIVATFKAQCKKDIADGRPLSGHYWSYVEEEVHERVEVTE